MDEIMDVVKLHAEDEMNLRSQAIMPAADAQVLMPMMNLDMAMKRLREFKEFVQSYLVADEDYGTIPGTPKPTLFKSGAEKLCDIYGMSDDYAIESRVENYQANPPLFDYTIKCSLTSRRDGRFIGAGFGSCNSYEGKYKWRETKRKCPLCGKETIIKGKAEYGGGFLCWNKPGKSDGCGAKFLDTDTAITEQKSGREFNDDIATLKNTILKMAKKRAKVDAVIAATRSSGIFSQDMDDIGSEDNGQGTKAAADRVAERRLAEHAAKRQATTPQGTASSTAQAVTVAQAGDFNAAVAEAGFKQDGSAEQDDERVLREVFGDGVELPDGFEVRVINGVSALSKPKPGKKQFFDVTWGNQSVRYFVHHENDPTRDTFVAQKGKSATMKLKAGTPPYGPTITGILSIGDADMSKLAGNDAAQ